MTKFWNFSTNDSGDAELRIDGDIQMEQSFWGWLFGLKEQTATNFREELKQYDGKDVTVWINSNGGEVYAASVMYTALKAHNGKVTVKIDGTCISAASVIAMAGDEILMSPTSVMMIHNPMTIAEGEAKDMEQALKVLNEVKDTIMNAYVKKTNKSRAEISALMDAETWMGAKKAIELGFADGVLFEEENDVTDDVINSLLSGAKLVYNSSFGTTKLKEQFKEFLKNQNPINQQDESAQDMAFAMLEIEKNRF